MAAVFAVCLCVLLLPAASGLQSEDRECAFTDHLQGAEPHIGPANELRENGTIRCSRGSRCYGLWEKRADGEMHLVKQGCWTHIGDQRECHGDRCLVTAMPSQVQNGSYRFCCCSRDLCNANFTEAPPTADAPALKPMKGDGRDNSQTDHQRLSREETALVALVTVAIAAILIMALFLGYRMMKGKRFHALSALDLMEAGNTESAVDLDNLKLLELIGRGRYGTVFRGSLKDGCVAVKLFTPANRHTFSNERSIYLLPLLQEHDSIAGFLSAHERSAADGQPELLLLMEYYPHGCLSRYLASHAVDWLTCCRMSHGVTRGLAFLHTEIYRGGQYKPAVAHRDVTCRNVLVRADLSCVLADFGLSMKLTGNPACRHGDDDTVAISEVGTMRYMAPEVLGGALNLRDCESALKQVDVYALGLLYWESFRRCSDLFPGGAAPEFQLAFQAELGNHPSFEQMQNLVSREKFRPRFPEAWKENSLVLHFLKETMEDCWDQDAEARLTAQCAEERLCELTLLSTPQAAHNHRNLAHGWWSPQVGSASSYIEDLQVGVVKNLQADSSFVSAAAASERNRNSINSERQQAQTRFPTSDSSLPTPASVLQPEHTCGLVSGIHARLQLTEEDLEAKLHPPEVDKNLKDSSDENLMECSLKQFSSHQPEAPPTSIQPLRKQQNVPQRPSSLHLFPHASSPRALLKVKSNRRQVETGVAKMNTVTVAAAAEPHVVTTVTNNTRGSLAHSIPEVTSREVAAVAMVMTNGARGRGGQTNPAGPQLEEERGMEGGGESHLLLLNFSPDEHEPLLRREQPPAESPPPPPPPPPPQHQAGHGSNSNNNNNRSASGSEVRPGIILPGGAIPQPHPDPLPGPAAHDHMPASEARGQRSDPGPGLEDPELTSGQTQSPVPVGRPADSGCPQEPPASHDPTCSTGDPEAWRPVQDPSDSQSPDPVITALHGASAPEPGDQVNQTRTRRPERPCSLDLSLSAPFSDDLSLSVSGEKIKRRVKTPYTLKKWRPASWVVSTDTGLDPDFNGLHHPSALPRTGSVGGMFNINQSKSSMAVFLVGSGATTTTTSEPDGVTSF